MDQDKTQNQEDEGKIEKLEQELDILGQKAKEEISEKSQPQPEPELKPEMESKPTEEQESTLPQQPTSEAQDNEPALQPQPQQPLMEESGGKNKIAKIAMILLLFSVFLAVLYFAKEYFLNPKPESTPTPISISTPSPTPDETAMWKIYSDNNLSFKYPQEWTLTSEKLIESSSPSAKLRIFGESNAMSNKCMEEDSTQTQDGLLIIKYSANKTVTTCSSVVTGEEKEIWIIKEDKEGYGPGIILSYSMSDSIEIEKIFDQILLTFEFMSEEECESCNATTSGELN